MEEDAKGQDPNRRRFLKILGMGGVVAATVALPARWTRPVVESVVTPAHAKASGPNTTLPPTSDIRLKRDIVRVGELDNGLALYRFRYHTSDAVYVGVMAQEALRVVPEAVVAGSDGYLRVDYARLGIRMMRWEEWIAGPLGTVGAKALPVRAASPGQSEAA